MAPCAQNILLYLATVQVFLQVEFESNLSIPCSKYLSEGLSLLKKTLRVEIYSADLVLLLYIIFASYCYFMWWFFKISSQPNFQ